MMSRQNKRPCLGFLSGVVLWFASVTLAATGPEYVAAGQGVYAIHNTFTLLPGTGSPFNTADDDVVNHDYGGSGSLCVASASARADSPLEGIDHDPKGLFRSVLRFDSLGLSADSLTSLALNLNILNGNQSAFDLYNYRGAAGQFDVYLVYDGWNQGAGTPHNGAATIANPLITDAYDTDPLTHNNLDAMLREQTFTQLATFTYDAAVPYVDGATWYSFDLTATLQNADFLAALTADGGTFSLMLSPTWIDENNDGINDNQVAFNFTTRAQQKTNGSYTYREDGPVFSFAATPEPASITILLAGMGVLLHKRNSYKKANLH